MPTLYRFYNILSSAGTTVISLLILCAFYLAGTIFPQGISLEEYKMAGGRFIFLAENLRLLNIFNSPAFLFTAGLFSLNLILCSLNLSVKNGNPRFYLTKIYHMLIIGVLAAIFISTFTWRETVLEIKEGGYAQVKLNNKDIKVFLKKFIVEYIESPSLTFKKGFTERVKGIFGNSSNAPLLILDQDSLPFYREFNAEVQVSAGTDVKSKIIQVNSPLRFFSYTIYLFGFDQVMNILINGKNYRVKPDEEFIVPGVDGIFKSSAIINGKVLRVDSSEDEISPMVVLSRKDAGGGSNWVKFLKAGKGTDSKADGISVALSDYEQYVTLSVRYDPAVGIMKWLSFVLMIFMSLSVIIKII
ncbi:MAG TPA: cytochrome c biogenesis protein ResB [bacterium]